MRSASSLSRVFHSIPVECDMIRAQDIYLRAVAQSGSHLKAEIEIYSKEQSGRLIKLDST